VDKKNVHKALQERVYNPCNQVKTAVENKELTVESTILIDSAREKLKMFYKIATLRITSSLKTLSSMT
jgi:hypothetical protein